MKPQQEKANHYYQSLRRRMVLIMLLVSLTPLLLVSGMILYEFRTAYKRKVYDHLGELISKHSQAIDGFLNERLADIRFLAENYTFKELSNESFLTNMLQSLRKNYGPVFVDLGVVDAQGLQVAYAGPFRLEKASYANALWFKRAIKVQYFISDVFLGLRRLPHFIVTVRQKDQNGKFWILRATIDFEFFNNIVENIQVGKTGFAFIFNRNGKLQTKSGSDIVPDKKIVVKLLKHSIANQNNITVIETRDILGKKKIYVSTFLKNHNWIMVFQQDASDAFSEFTQTLRLSLLMILFGSLAIIVTALILAKRMVKRIARTDKEKEQMNEQLIQAGKLASLGELAAGIAHEINNPVAIMLEEAGWIDDLLEEEEFQNSSNLQEIKRAINQIRTQGRRCKQITHKLLSFARKTDPAMQEVQINDLINELVAFSTKRAKYANITITTDLGPNLPYVKASPSELQQVFLNLINNALDAMEKNGGILSIKTRLEDNYIKVEVSDTGPGIPEANLKRIFDPFFTTKPVGKGTGLGLSICYGIIKKSGGDIKVTSTVGKGTTFIVTLPIKPSSIPDQIK